MCDPFNKTVLHTTHYISCVKTKCQSWRSRGESWRWCYFNIFFMFVHNSNLTKIKNKKIYVRKSDRNQICWLDVAGNVLIEWRPPSRTFWSKLNIENFWNCNCVFFALHFTTFGILGMWWVRWRSMRWARWRPMRSAVGSGDTWCNVRSAADRCIGTGHHIIRYWSLWVLRRSFLVRLFNY